MSMLILDGATTDARVEERKLGRGLRALDYVTIQGVIDEAKDGVAIMQITDMHVSPDFSASTSGSPHFGTLLLNCSTQERG